MNDIRQKKYELYKQQKYLRELSMAKSSYEQKEKIRKEQDKLYKKFIFYQGLTDTMDKRKASEKNEIEITNSKKM